MVIDGLSDPSPRIVYAAVYTAAELCSHLEVSHCSSDMRSCINTADVYGLTLCRELYKSVLESPFSLLCTASSARLLRQAA